MKKITKTLAKKKAWSIFSKYIRTKHADFVGTVHCYTCDKLMDIKTSQAGHGIPGRNNAVLFLEEVVKPQCVGCNIYGRGKQSIFTMKLIKELGMKRYEEIVTESNRVVQYKTQDYIDIHQKYTELLKQI